MSEHPKNNNKNHQNNNHINNNHNNNEQHILHKNYKNNFLVESEIISKYIIEKIISLSMTESLKNKVNKLIPNYCYDQLYETLGIITQLDFISYDKDDFPLKRKKQIKKMKSFINLKNNNIIPPIENFEQKEIQNSEIIRKYKFEKQYDINIDDIDIDLSVFERSEKNEDEINNNNKIFCGILKREKYDENNNSFQQEEIKKEKKLKKYNKKHNYHFKDDKLNIIKEIYSSKYIEHLESKKENEPFQINPDEAIEEIQKVESHKLDINISSKNNLEQNINTNIYLSNKIKNKKNLSIPFEKIIEGTNYWKPILQPSPPPIDRDAGTKIKYDKPLKFSKKMISKIITDEKSITPDKQPNKQPINNEINNNNEIQKRKKRINFYSTLDKSPNKNKKKKILEIPFDSTDIDPKKLISHKESDDIAFLREYIEKTIQEKKKEKEIQLKIEKEKQSKLQAIEDMRKELHKKNVTVDVKGDIVYIKPIDMKSLIEEFNKTKSNFKNIKVLETEAQYDLTKMNIKVEKNLDFLKEDLKNEEKNKKKKKKIGFYLPPKNGANSNNMSSSPDINKKSIIADKGLKFVSGSNFNIINPEIGVNITENKMIKSGGKDFLKKFNRFSLEVFQEQLSKTSNSFFPRISEENDINNDLNENNNNKRKMSTVFSNKKIDKILEYKNKNKKYLNAQTITRNHNEKNSLSLKTKNLNIVLQDLDLITEREMKKLNKNKSKKINKTIFLKRLFNNTGTNKNNYNDMNKFAKTLVGKENWGIGTYTEREKYDNFKMPKKPENNELKRELPVNMLKHMPRKRLPPISSMIKLNTLTGFFTNRKPKKTKEINKENKDNKEKIESI